MLLPPEATKESRTPDPPPPRNHLATHVTHEPLLAIYRTENAKKLKSVSL